MSLLRMSSAESVTTIAKSWANTSSKVISANARMIPLTKPTSQVAIRITDVNRIISTIECLSHNHTNRIIRISSIMDTRCSILNSKVNGPNKILTLDLGLANKTLILVQATVDIHLNKLKISLTSQPFINSSRITGLYKALRRKVNSSSSNSRLQNHLINIETGFNNSIANERF